MDDNICYEWEGVLSIDHKKIYVIQSHFVKYYLGNI